jgi:hypothetical protein
MVHSSYCSNFLFGSFLCLWSDRSIDRSTHYVRHIPHHLLRQPMTSSEDCFSSFFSSFPTLYVAHCNHPILTQFVSKSTFQYQILQEILLRDDFLQATLASGSGGDGRAGVN